jgi:hypothetical protein
MFPIHLFIIAFFMSIWDRLTIKDNAIRFNSQACVVIVAGKTGSGKSFSAINEMIRFKKRFKDGIIFSNMTSKLVDYPLSLDCFYSINDVPYLIVVDEANSVYGAKMKSDVPDELKKTLYQIRKGVGKRVVLLTQDYSLLDANFRKLAHFVYETKTYFGRLTSYRRFEQTVYETNSQTGGLDLKKSGKQPSRVSLWILQTKRIRSLYDFKALVDVEWHKKKGSEKGVPAESL